MSLIRGQRIRTSRGKNRTARAVLFVLVASAALQCLFVGSSAYAAEVLSNPGFDTGTNCGAAIDGWTFTDSGPPTLAGQTTGMQAGDCSLRYYVDNNDPTNGYAEATFTYDQNNTIGSAAITYYRKSTPYSVNNCTNIITLVDPASVERTIDSRTCTSSSTWGQITANNTTAVKTALEAYNGAGTAWKFRSKWTIDDTNPTGLFIDTISFDITLSDTTAPTNPTLTPNGHTTSTWSTDNTVQMDWSGASDAGSGLNGYNTLFDTSASTDPGTGATTDAPGGGSGSRTSSTLADGNSHYFHLRTRDNAGNWSAVIHSGPFWIDTVAPTNPALTSSHTVSTLSSDNTIQMNFGASSDATSGVAGFSYSFDTNAVSTPDTVVDGGITSTTSGALADGTSHYFHIRTKDNAGNWSAATHSGPYFIDTTQPITTLSTSPAAPDGSNGWFKTTPSITLSRNESGATYYQWDGTADGSWTTYSSAFNSLAGQHTLYYRSVDTVGLTEDTKSQAFKVDTGFPSSTITSPATGLITNATSLPISGTASDSGASGLFVLQVQVDAGPWEDATGTTSWSYTWNISSEGAHQIRSRGMDNAGNIESPSTFITVTVDQTAPLVSSTDPTNNESNVEQTRDVTATFDEGMSADTISTSTFTLETSTGDPIAGTVSYNSGTRVATFNPTGNLPGDSITARVKTGVKDLAGNNLATEKVWSFTTAGAPDLLPPNTTLVTDPAAADGTHGWFRVTPDVTLTADEPASSYYQWDTSGDGGWSLYATPFEGLQDSHVLYYRSIDTAGNTEDTLNVTLKVDTVTPDNATDLESPSHPDSTPSVDATVQVIWTAGTDTGSGVAGYSYSFNASPVATPDTVSDLGSGVTEVTSAPLSTGSQYFHIRTVDDAGNWSAAAHLGPFVIDSAPTTTLTSSPSSADGTNGWFITSPTITLTPSESSTSYYQWDSTSDGGWTTYAGPFVDAPAGEHTLWYRSIDTGGSTEDPLSRNFKVDDPDEGGEAPTDPTDAASTSHTVGVLSFDMTIDVSWSSGTDDTSGVDGYAVVWDGKSDTAPEHVITNQENDLDSTSPELFTGRWFMHLSTKDNAGNWTSTEHLGPFDVVGTELAVGPHGGYTAVTNKCKNCHRPHRAPGYRLIFARDGSYSTIAGFCFTCHKDGAGANNDVYYGIFRGTRTGSEDASGNPLYSIENTSYYGEAGAGLNGGGFVTARPYTGIGNRTGATADVTSRHDVIGVPGVSPDNVTMWGSTDTGPGQSVAPLWCVSCHIPHGSTNYRLLRDKLTPPGGRDFPANTVKSHEMPFDTSATTGNLLRSYTTTSYWQGIVRFCTSCHRQYGTSVGLLENSNGNFNAGDGYGSIKRYRHSESVPLSNWEWPGYDNWGQANGNIASNLNQSGHTMVPLEQESWSTRASQSDRIVCLTCHQVHGTSSATVTADSRAGPTTQAYSSSPGYSNLLRLDYRSVCENCHDWWHNPSDRTREN